MSDFVYTIVDEHGYIGTFSTLDKAKELVHKYHKVNMIIRRYTLDSRFPKDKVWFIPYININHPIIVTNDKENVKYLQYQYLKLNMTYPDKLVFFERTVDELHLYEYGRLVADDDEREPMFENKYNEDDFNNKDDFIKTDAVDYLDTKSIQELINIINSQKSSQPEHTSSPILDGGSKQTYDAPSPPPPSLGTNNTSVAENYSYPNSESPKIEPEVAFLHPIAHKDLDTPRLNPPDLTLDPVELTKVLKPTVTDNLNDIDQTPVVVEPPDDIDK